MIICRENYGLRFKFKNNGRIYYLQQTSENDQTNLSRDGEETPLHQRPNLLANKLVKTKFREPKIVNVPLMAEEREKTAVCKRGLHLCRQHVRVLTHRSKFVLHVH